MHFNNNKETRNIFLIETDLNMKFMDAFDLNFFLSLFISFVLFATIVINAMIK